MAAGGSAAAAAAARERLLEEEEEMTTYSKEDLANDWEFKIVRSGTGAFRNPAALDKLRQQESQAGWVLVEKFDNSRVRFKRPLSARENDYRLPQGVDPYRTYYGLDSAVSVIIILVIFLGFVGIIIFGALAISLGFLGNSFH
jgi:hypothetical protein